MFGLKDMTGAVLSPFDAFLMARGLKTLDIRMERHCANAQKVAAFFTSHPAVAKVYYPGLDTFPGHEIAAKQMKLPGRHPGCSRCANRGTDKCRCLTPEQKASCAAKSAPTANPASNEAMIREITQKVLASLGK